MPFHIAHIWMVSLYWEFVGVPLIEKITQMSFHREYIGMDWRMNEFTDVPLPDKI